MGDRYCTMTDKRWRSELVSQLCFGLPLSFFPIVCLYVLAVHDGHRMALRELATDSGTLTIAIALAASGLSRLVSRAHPWRTWNAVSFVVSMAVIVLGSMCYVLPRIDPPRNATFFTNLCAALIATSVITTIGGLLLNRD